MNPWFETVAEAQRRAKKRLPKSVYGALIAGSERGQTIEETSGRSPNWVSRRTSRARSATVTSRQPYWDSSFRCRC
jgi:pre-mycofactocin synthase